MPTQNFVIIGLVNHFSPVWLQTVTWTNADILSIELTNDDHHVTNGLLDMHFKTISCWIFAISFRRQCVSGPSAVTVPRLYEAPHQSCDKSTFVHIYPDNKVHGPTWVPSGADRAQVGPMLAPWTLLFVNPHVRPLSCDWFPFLFISGSMGEEQRAMCGSLKNIKVSHAPHAPNICDINSLTLDWKTCIIAHLHQDDLSDVPRMALQFV